LSRDSGGGAGGGYPLPSLPPKAVEFFCFAFSRSHAGSPLGAWECCLDAPSRVFDRGELRAAHGGLGRSIGEVGRRRVSHASTRCDALARAIHCIPSANGECVAPVDPNAHRAEQRATHGGLAGRVDNLGRRRASHASTRCDALAQATNSVPSASGECVAPIAPRTLIAENGMQRTAGWRIRWIILVAAVHRTRAQGAIDPQR